MTDSVSQSILIGVFPNSGGGFRRDAFREPGAGGGTVPVPARGGHGGRPPQSVEVLQVLRRLPRQPHHLR